MAASMVAAALAAAAGNAAAAALPRFDHVVVVVMENHGYTEIIGNATAPYINSLAAGGALFTQSYAIEHPSQPNYLDLFSGANQGVTDDTCPHTFTTDNLGSALLAANLTFAGYSEDLPIATPKTCTSGNYARKHNPWIDFTNVPAASNQPLSAFPADYATLPTFAFVVPNLCNDMHDCTIATGDAWLQNHLDGYLQWARTHASLLVLTWDEDDHSEANRITTVFAGASVAAGSYDESVDHFRVLATLAAMYGLAPPAAAAQRAPIVDVWDDAVYANGFD